VKIIYIAGGHDATTKRHSADRRHKTGVKKDGTIVAIEVDCIPDGVRTTR